MSTGCIEARDEVAELQYEETSTPFFPLDRLQQYFQPEKVREILSCGCPKCQGDLHMYNVGTEPEDYVRRIAGEPNSTDTRRTFYSVFGLLVYIERPLFIIGFMDRNCNDYLLESWSAHSSLTGEGLRQYTGTYQVRDPGKYNRFAKKFLAALPQFAIPHLEQGDFSEYDEKVIFPFIEEVEIGKRSTEDGRLTSEGANGKVYALKVYCGYHFPRTSSRAEYVRKRIQTPRPRQAFLERSNIQYVQQFENDHIVKLIKAYGHGESINLIFPRAWTNLDRLLRDPTYEYGSKRGPRLDRADAWKQVLGISSALKQMHGYGGEATRRTRDASGVLGQACIHFDLKPDNILVEREGNWLITDFGQAALTERRRGTTPHVGGHFGTDAYAPPEIDDTSMEVGRAYDVWSLGCIMLEVTAFMVLSYAGLNGATSFTGLDQARQSMPYWARNRDERFFYQEVPNGAYVVKKEIQTFKSNLESSHTRSNDSDAASRAFLSTIMDLIDSMLKPIVGQRTDVSTVVDTLSSALAQAHTDLNGQEQNPVVAASDERVLGGPGVSNIKLWHSSATGSIRRRSNLEIFENSSGYIRLHCWAPGVEPSNVSFRRSDAKIVPLYTFWDPDRIPKSREWIDFFHLSADRCSEIPSSRYSFDDLKHARVIQSSVTSQDIVESFNLGEVVVRRPASVGQAVRGFFRIGRSNQVDEEQRSDERSMQLGSATVQIWVERPHVLPPPTNRRLSLVSRNSTASRSLRPTGRDQSKTPPCRVCIYLHKQHFVCTVKIDANWVLDESTADNKVLRFIPLPKGRNRTFYASWLRPTPEEFASEEQYPAGIPLDPRVLQYFEDIDCFEVEGITLTFRTADDRTGFKWKYLETKKNWDDARRAATDAIEVNRAPDRVPQLPDGLNNLPVPARRVPLIANSSAGRNEQSISSTSTNGSRYDSGTETVTSPQNPNF